MAFNYGYKRFQSCPLRQHPYFRSVVKNVPSKIFLIGLMGSGKSYWGRHLANHFHYPFLDLDKGIEMNNDLINFLQDKPEIDVKITAV